MHKKLIKIPFILLLPLLLTHCIGSVFTGARMFYDRHELSQQVNNYKIVNQANHLLQKHKYELAGSRVAPASFNYEMLLVGQVKSNAVRLKLANMMKSVRGVKIIYNYLTVDRPINFAKQSRDSWITTKIISQLVTNNDIDPDEFKIVTEDSLVYIMGHVKRRQGDIAVNIASHTRGVKKVVKLLRYITLS